MFPASVAMSPRTRKQGRQCAGATCWSPAGDQTSTPTQGGDTGVVSCRNVSVASCTRHGRSNHVAPDPGGRPDAAANLATTARHFLADCLSLETPS